MIFGRILIVNTLIYIFSKVRKETVLLLLNTTILIQTFGLINLGIDLITNVICSPSTAQTEGGMGEY